MPTVQPGLTILSLAEVAWLVSRAGRQFIAGHAEPSSEALKEFWQATRQLQRSWDETLESGPLDQNQLSDLLARVLATDMVCRTWGTALGCLEKRNGRNDLTRIAANVIGGLLQIRNRVLSAILSDPTLPSAWGAEQDRLRRRCDRWTDLLIGTLCGFDNFYQFAVDADRARDFAEESQAHSPERPVELLMAAGLRLSFLRQLPEVSLDTAAYERLIQSILASLPEQAFSSSGLMKSVEFGESNAKPDDSVLIPGFSLEKLRRRFSHR